MSQRRPPPYTGPEDPASEEAPSRYRRRWPQRPWLRGPVPPVNGPGWYGGGGAGQASLASGINFLAGLWFIISPWVFAYNGNSAALWNSVATGGALAILALWRTVGAYRLAGISFINALLGVWIFFSPWIFGYQGNGSAFWNSIVLGVVVFILSLWSAAVTSSGAAVD